MFQKILVPTDGSPLAHDVAVLVARFAQETSDVHVTVAVAICPLTDNNSALDDAVIERENALMRQNAGQLLDSTSIVFAAAGIPTATKILYGDPVSQAVACEALSGGYDLVAVGSRGMGMDRHDARYAGSVTEHLIRRIDIPVLVLPQHKI